MALDFSRFGTPVEQAPVLDFSKFGTPVEAEKEEPPSRTFGEAAGDVGASLVKGLGQAAQFPGQLVGLVPGMRGMGEALAAPGAALAEYGEGLKSAGLKAREALRNKALSEAEKEGFLAEFSTAIGQTIKDPALLSSFLLEQVPQLLGPVAAIKVTTMLGRKGVQAAAEGEARKAAETSLRKRAAAAAVGTGAAAQGSSIGDETYEAVYDLAIKQGKSEEEARALAAEKARVAALEAGAISVATSRLPGGSAIERRLAGLPGVPGAGRIGVGVREGFTEGLEEAGGAFAKGVGMAEVEPTISPVTGVGTAAGLGVVGGAGLGVLVGGRPLPEEVPRPGAPGGETLIERRAREAAEAAEAPAEPTPPEAAPEVPEPIVRKPVKPGELPETLPQVLDDATVRAIGFVPGKGKKKTFYDKLVGKDLSNPKDLETVRSMLTNFVEKKRHDGELKGAGLRAETVLGKLPPAPAVTPTPAPPAPAPEAAAPAAEVPVVETPTPPPAAEAAAPAPEAAPPVAPPPPAPAVEAAAPAPAPEAPRVEPIEPEAGGAGAPVAGGPTAVTPTEGAGAVEPVRVVPAEPDAEQPAGGEGAEPVAVTPPAAEPEYTEEDIDRAVDLGVLSEEEADAYRAELRGEEAPATAMAAAFEERVAALKAEQDKLLQKNGKIPALKSKNRAKFDELQAQIEALGVAQKGKGGDLLKRLEAVGATGVFTVRGENPIVDFRALKGGLVKARAKPQMIEAVLAYVGFDNDGYLTRPMSRDEAAQSVGMKTSSGANVSEVAEKLGITAEVRSRFHASQTDKIGIAKNVSESSESQLTDVGPKRGLLYEPPTKKKPAKVVKFLSSALTPDGKLDFTNIPLESQKATKRAKAVTGLAEMYVRSSFYNMDRNSAVLKQLRAEVDARIKRDTEQANAIKAQMKALRQDGKVPLASREEYKALEAQLPQTAKTRDAINRAYGVLTAEQEAEISEAELQRTLSDIKKGDLTPVGELADLTPEEVVEKIRNGEANVAGDVIREQGAKDPEKRKEGKTRASKLEGEEKEQFGEEVDEEVEAEARTTTPAYPEIEPEEAKRIEGQIRGKSLVQAAEFIAGYFRVGDQKLIAQRVVDRLRRMESAGVDFNLVLVEPGVRAPTSIATGNANGLSHLTYVNGKPKITVYLRSVDIGTSGINPRIMLHEFLHAATQAAIHLGNLRGAAGTNTAKFTGELIDLQNAFIKHFNQRVSDSKAGKVNLTEIEKSILNRDVNAGLDPHELLAWGLTNPKFQQYLETIPYKARTMWTAFVDSIRSFLGMAPRVDTALSELLHVSEDILQGDPYEEIALSRRIFGTQAAPGVQTPAIAPETEKAVKGVNVIGEQAPALTPKGNPALRMRIKFADSLAGLEDVFTAAYSGQVRTATGRLNPMVLLSRALDTQRVSRAVQKEGALVTKEGLLMADKLVVDGREISYKDTLARIAETAKKEDKTYEQYRETIDKVLYGHLEYNLREYNRNLDQQADALEAAGKIKDAKAMRADKITLALNDKQIDALENAFQKDTFIKGISKDLDAIRFSLLDKLVEVGRISAEKAKEWKENTGYIPLQRIAEYAKEYDEAGRGTNRGVVAMKNIRKREGSERATTSPVENFSQFMDWAVGEAMKNEAGTRALTDLELLGSAKRQAEPPAFDSPGGMVTVYEKGVPVKFYVQDPGLYVGLSLQEKELGSIAKAFQRLGTQPLRAGVTALPPFAVKQVFDDIVRAYAYAGVKNNAAVVKNTLLNFPKNWYKEIFKVRDKGIQELENLGVVGTFDFTKQGNLKNILEEAGAKKEGLGSAIFRVMEAGAKASDLAVRQAIYNQVLKETGDIAQAESAAREIINFSRRGASGAMRTAISVIPFFNAYAQGMDKLATAAAGRVVGTKLGVARSMFYKRMAVLTGMGLAYALLMSDDENYQALSDHVRDTNWILPYGKYLGYTPGIPIPAELAFFFKAIPERIVQFYKHQGTDEERAALDVVKELLVRGVDVFSSPNLTPQLIRPFLENITNHSWFLNRPLESQAQLRQRPFMRAGIGTSDSMKAVAELLEDAANATGIEAITISPIKLENLIRGLLGTAGGTALALSDAAFFPSRTDRPLHQQLKSQLTGASAVMKDAVGTRYLDKVYKLESDVEQVYNTYNRLLQDKPEKTAEFIEDNKGLYSIRPAVQGLMTAIRSLNTAARQIDKTTDIRTDERRRRIDELRIEQNDLARQALMLRKMAMDIQLGK